MGMFIQRGKVTDGINVINNFTNMF